MNNYGDYEDKILDNLQHAANNIGNKLKLNDLLTQQPIIEPEISNNEGEKGNQMKRVRKNDGAQPINHEPSNEEPVSSQPNYFNGASNNISFQSNYSNGINNNAASSFILIVLGILVLISMIALITFKVLNYVGK